MASTFVDLFSGAGGLSQGLVAAGAVPVAAVDIDADACRTYALAHPGVPVIKGDVTNAVLPRTDLLVGGPPCQPFSVHGRQGAAGDERDGIPLFIEALRSLQPRAFIMENVPNLTAKRHEAYFGGVLGQLRQVQDEPMASYVVGWRILDAADWGVPQHRRRLFVVGIRLDVIAGREHFRWPTPTHGPGRGLPWVTVREALTGYLNTGEPNPSKVVYASNPTLRPKLANSLIVNGRGRVLSINAPSVTIAAESSGNGGHILDPLRVLDSYHQRLLHREAEIRSGVVRDVRRLTTGEAARLQGFDPSYPFQGSVSSRFRQIGNAVPPPLARAVAGAVLAALGR